MGLERLEAFLDDSTSFLSGKKVRQKDERQKQAAFTHTCTHTHTHQQGENEDKL